MRSLRFRNIMMCGLLLALCGQGTWAWGVDPAVLEAEAKRVAVVENVSPTVVAIFGAGGGGGGSGVLISPDGYALTNFHVTSGAGDFMKCGLNDGVLYDAVIVGIDPTGDVAMIKLLGRDDFPYATLGDSDRVQVGDWAYAMGNPFLLATDFQPTVTYGIVSGVNRYQYPAGTFLEYADCIQFDTSINPGNSGGPLFNDDGEVIGINGRGSFEKRGRVNSGAGYAISINQIKHFMDHLRSGRIVDHATLGATVTSDSDGAIVVSNILERSEAYRRGLRIDDEIVSFAGRPIRSVNQFKNVLGIYPKGWKLPLVYRRGNQKEELFVRLRGLHHESEMVPGQRRPQRPPQPMPQPEQPENDNDDNDPENDNEQDAESEDSERPKEEPRRQPRRPGGHPFHQMPEPPEEYKHMLVKKEGFSNYFFNELEQQRVLDEIAALGDFSEVSGVWIVSGKTGSGAPFEITLSDKGAGLTVGEEAYFQPLELADPEDEPQDTGGLLVALHHFRKFLSEGPEAFTEFLYLGSEPLDGRGDSADVLVSTLTGVETRWYVRQNDGFFAGFDTHLTEDADACEVRFEEFKQFDGRTFPGRIVVGHAAREYDTFQIERVELHPAAQVEAAARD